MHDMLLFFLILIGLGVAHRIGEHSERRRNLGDGPRKGGINHPDKSGPRPAPPGPMRGYQARNDGKPMGPPPNTGSAGMPPIRSTILPNITINIPMPKGATAPRK